MPQKDYKSSPSSSPTAERELVVIAKAEVGLRATAEGVASVAEADVSPLSDLLFSEGVTLRPLFGVSEDRLKFRAATLSAETGVETPDLSVYYRVEAPDEKLESLAEKLRESDAVHTAFIKPGAELPQAINDMAPAAEPPPPMSPDFTARQGYLDAAPGGIDARYAWTVNGGSGAGVRIIDVEGAWRFSHEDLIQNQGGVVGGTPTTDIGWRNHGTAVTGEFGGDRNTFGITGICPDANIRAISIFGLGSAAAIHQAADLLGPGDIILIELHRPGPRFNFQSPQGQRGYIPIEWWPDDMAAIQYAVSRGVIVVEAGGNGSENLDDQIYDINPPAPNGPFPPSWRNPFRRNPIDTGAVVVGAGAPPQGTHGRDWGPDRSRLDFSNFGSMIDAQGWGREVTSCGYGDLQGGTNEDLWYTDQFSGTSSASPIIVGTVGCLQGVLRAAGKSLLTPATARGLLRSKGSPQQNGPSGPTSQRIGNRPDLRQMINSLIQAQVSLVPLYRYWNPGIGDHFYTTSWAELGSGRNGWGYEGIQCYVFPQPQSGTVPLYRYWNPSAGDHFYTTNWAELGSGRYGWGYEGIQCYVFPQPQSGTVPLYRYWNPSNADHFYTTNWGELGSGRYGWGYEGIQCYVYQQPTGSPSADVGPTTEGYTLGSLSGGETGGETGGSLSAIPQTFDMGSSAVGPQTSADTGFTESSFMSKTGEESGQSGLGDSFTVSPSKAGQRQSSGQVTVNINLGAGPND